MKHAYRRTERQRRTPHHAFILYILCEASKPKPSVCVQSLKRSFEIIRVPLIGKAVIDARRPSLETTPI